MLAHPTSDRLTAPGLTGMARALDDQRRTPACEALVGATVHRTVA